MKRTAAIILTILLAACVSPENPQGWHRNPAYPEPMQTVVWEHEPDPAALRHRCVANSDWTGVACAWRFQATRTCVILSTLTEAQGRIAWWHDGLTIYDHEKRHCDGMDRAATSVWSMTRAQGVVR